MGGKGIPHWLALRSRKASTAHHIQYSPYTLHRKTDFAIKCDDVLRVGRNDCSLRSDFFFCPEFIQHSLQVSSNSGPAVTSQGKIRLSSSTVEDVDGKNEEQRVEVFFAFSDLKLDLWSCVRM